LYALSSSRQEVVEQFNGLRPPSEVLRGVLARRMEVSGEVAFFNDGVEKFLVASACSRTIREQPIRRGGRRYAMPSADEPLPSTPDSARAAASASTFRQALI